MSNLQSESNEKLRLSSRGRGIQPFEAGNVVVYNGDQSCELRENDDVSEEE